MDDQSQPSIQPLPSPPPIDLMPPVDQGYGGSSNPDEEQFHMARATARNPLFSTLSQMAHNPRALAYVGLFVVAIALPATVFLAQRQQTLHSNAATPTTAPVLLTAPPLPPLPTHPPVTPPPLPKAAKLRSVKK